MACSKGSIGTLFEHLLFSQMIHSAHSQDQEVRVSTYRTEHGAEVDFIVERGAEIYAVEAKASRTLGSMDMRGLKSFAEYTGKKRRSFVFYLGDVKKKIGEVEILPWQEGFQVLGF